MRIETSPVVTGSFGRNVSQGQAGLRRNFNVHRGCETRIAKDQGLAGQGEDSA